eukprot:COSAG01_NODE_1494_length_10125_cov_93.590805_5_plen_246_part_00
MSRQRCQHGCSDGSTGGGRRPSPPCGWPASVGAVPIPPTGTTVSSTPQSPGAADGAKHRRRRARARARYDPSCGRAFRRGASRTVGCPILSITLGRGLAACAFRRRWLAENRRTHARGHARYAARRAARKAVALERARSELRAKLAVLQAERQAREAEHRQAAAALKHAAIAKFRQRSLAREARGHAVAAAGAAAAGGGAMPGAGAGRQRQRKSGRRQSTSRTPKVCRSCLCISWIRRQEPFLVD